MTFDSIPNEKLKLIIHTLVDILDVVIENQPLELCTRIDLEARLLLIKKELDDGPPEGMLPIG